MPVNKRFKSRLLHHFLIPLISFAFAGLIYAALHNFYPETQRRTFLLSLTTAYISVILLSMTLTLGAWNVFHQISNPVSSDLRRDVGIWCGAFSIAHILLGLNVHLQSWTQYFINNSGQWLTDSFGVANYLGVLAALIVILLVATSNDISLRYLGRSRWKSLQRLNYLFVFLAALHGFIYQIVEKRLIPFGFIYGIIILSIAAIQIAGFQIKRRAT